MHVGGWLVNSAGNGNMRALNWPASYEGFPPNGTGYSGDYILKDKPTELKDNNPGDAVPDYVPLEEVGTISIRTLNESADGAVGFGPEAEKPVVAKLFCNISRN